MSGGSDDIRTDRTTSARSRARVQRRTTNLGAEDGKGNPPTVVPSDGGDTDDADVLAEDPEDG